MATASLNFDDQGGKPVQQGATFYRKYRLDTDSGVYDLTDHTAKFVIKNSRNKNSLIELTTENGGVILGGDEGILELKMSPSTTAEIPAGRYSYYLELTQTVSGRSHKIFVGELEVSPQVTI